MPEARTAVDAAEVEAFLGSDEGRGFTLVDGRLHRELRFAGFAEAFGFMTSVAVVAERLNHHPDWSNAWNRVTIDLVTHSAGGLTTLDLALAREIGRLAGPH